MYKVDRYHDFSCGHRVAGHESKCALLHGHNYRVTFTCVPEEGLDTVGRVIDFSFIKSALCQWLEDNWDHKTLLWLNDGDMGELMHVINHPDCTFVSNILKQSIVWVPFNPTAENMARYLVEVVGPERLRGTGAKLMMCKVEETRKCSATFVGGSSS